MTTVIKHLAGVLIVLCWESSVHAQQSGPTLQITSPTDRTVVSPGQTITILVNATPANAFSQLLLVGDNPIGFSAVNQTASQFTLVIPANIAADTYQLTALGAITPGTLIASPPVNIAVEPATAPVSLNLLPGLIAFDYSGDQTPVSVIGTLADGSIMDLTNSTGIKYTVPNTNTAKVSASGLLTATGPGQTAILATYGNQVASGIITVPQGIPGDLNGDGRVDLDDLNILRAFLNAPAVGAFDARDLNHDGVINALDARILATLCTKQGCATD